jgi:hypothetical protein
VAIEGKEMVDRRVAHVVFIPFTTRGGCACDTVTFQIQGVNPKEPDEVISSK